MHTPGPWQKKAKYTVKRGNSLVASCHWRDGEANARLIAAAPEMLDALRGLMARDLEVSHSMWPEVQAARAAIEKATT